MKTVSKIEQVRRDLKKVREKGKRIGFVPTMGYFHEGHLSLIRRARKETDFVVSSIFVNPTQFGPREDYRRYPRNLSRDKKLAEDAGAELIFAPSVSEIYPPAYSTPLKRKRSLSLTGCTYVDVQGLGSILCGASRPGHFSGVATIVTKLFNIVQPDVAYFGQKDFQQAAIIKKMVEDLNMGVRIKVLPVVREEDGLAMSSRNTYLSGRERMDALVLYQSLQQARKMIKSNIRDSRRIKSRIKDLIKSKKSAKVDYIAIVDPENLGEVKKITRKVAVLLAVWIGKTRLIDNMLMGGK